MNFFFQNFVPNLYLNYFKSLRLFWLILIIFIKEKLRKVIFKCQKLRFYPILVKIKG